MASSKAVFLRNVPTGLIREAKAAAARRGVTLTTVFTEALSRSLSVHGATQAPANDLQPDMAWYRKNRAKLLRRYKGEYIAIIDGAVVDHGRDFNEVGTRVFARFGNRNIFMPLVQASDEVVRVRSPRIVKP
jgi:hypothetical protein